MDLDIYGPGEMVMPASRRANGTEATSKPMDSQNNTGSSTAPAIRQSLEGELVNASMKYMISGADSGLGDMGQMHDLTRKTLEAYATGRGVLANLMV